MPFPKLQQQPFTEANVSSLCPMQMGVYAIFDRQGKCLYIGQTADLRNTLLKHVRGQSFEAGILRENGAFLWMAALARTEQLDALEMIFDAEYRPACRN